MKYLKLTMLLLSVCTICGCGNKSAGTKDTETKKQEVVSSQEAPETQGTEPSENLIVGYYSYPDTEGMRPAQICEACRIPETTLKVMSSEQLAQAVADYPLLSEIALSSSSDYDVDWLIKKSDAYRELLSRKDAKDALLEKSEELETGADDDMIKAEHLRDVVLHEKTFQDELTNPKNNI